MLRFGVAAAGCLLSLSFGVPAVAGPKEDAAQWDKLFARKKEVIAELDSLQAKYKEAKPAEQKAIAADFEELRDELVKKLFPQLAELAPKIYVADPKNLDAGETAMEVAYQENRYEDSAKLADELIANGRENLLTRNIAGVSQFALHEFAKANKLLTAADNAGQLHPRLGGQYLEASAQYGKLWAAEQKIREKEAAAKGDDQLPRVLFKTNKGEILIELFENEAPNSVANFVSLVESKQYDKVKFHRVIPGFMAQGGDPLSKDDDPSNDGQGGPGYVIKCECHQPNARMHFRGSLSMAHAGKDSGGSQFFITHLPTPHLNPNPQAMSGHTVFGRVVEGLDVSAGLEVGDVIESATVVRKRKHEYKPKTQPE